jgi:hypothetical protein
MAPPTSSGSSSSSSIMVREPRDGQHQGTRLLVIALSAGLALTTAACGYLLLRDRGACGVCFCVLIGSCLTCRLPPTPDTLTTPANPEHHHHHIPPEAPPRLGGKRRRGEKSEAMPVEGSEVFPPLPEPVVALLQVGRWVGG